ncbi:MAG: TlyA family RNA methyltransferase [Magnetococcales bacterium]|nr:TlyA family RNA methyltransferase [Magnetococcales bacterium]
MPKSEKRQRLDQRVWQEGLTETLEHAQRLIMTGTILVDDRPMTKPGTLIASSARLRQKNKPIPWVSRGGLKLKHAIQHWSLSVRDRICLDVGAATGGFTQVLLHYGARSVIAMDVGYGQLDWKVASDPRVQVKERFNIRDLLNEDIPGGVDIVVVDCSFIGLSMIIPPILHVLKKPGSGIFLIKPQFELPAFQIASGGIVYQEEARQQAITAVTQQCTALGLEVHGVIPSPITGSQGNQEFLLYFSRL